MLKCCNHTSASTPGEEAAINKVYNKMVNHGWKIPIPLEAIPELKGVGVIPIRVTTQLTFSKQGEKIPKYRVT